MTRFLILIAGILVHSALLSQNVLVGTRLHPFADLDAGESLVLDLREFFQRYDESGPVATFSLRMPVADGIRDLFVEMQRDAQHNLVPKFSGAQIPMRTYRLASGGSYTHAYEIEDAAAFEWESFEVRFRLLPDTAPLTVANFMSYAGDGEYDSTVVHRALLSDLDRSPMVIQAGGYTLRTADSDKLLQIIPSRGNISFESSVVNDLGTIAMARDPNFLNSATSQFFVNLRDNRGNYGSAYVVFGELLERDVALPKLTAFGATEVYDLTRYFPQFSFATYPLYTPFFDLKSNHSRIESIRVAPGNPDGVSYKWEFRNAGETATEAELANQAAFEITLEGSDLRINPVDTGVAFIRVTGSLAGSTDRSFDVQLQHYNQAAIAAFPASEISQGGWLISTWYGSLNGHSSFPHIQHEEHGRQLVAKDPRPGSNGLFFKDEILATWLYTSPAIYPNMYHYGRQQWLFYARRSGAGLDDSRVQRWFYVRAGGELADDEPLGEWMPERQIAPTVE